MTQNPTPEMQMIQACAALYNVTERIVNELKPFFGWEKIWQSECTRLLHGVESLRDPAKIVFESYQASDRLPKDASTIGQARSTVQTLNEYIDEACVKIVAYAENSDSLSEVHLRSRLRLRKYVQGELLQIVEQLLDMLPIPLPQDVSTVVIEEDRAIILLLLARAKEVAE